MEVILLEKVQNLGNLGDKVSVRPGFGRNYLVPGALNPIEIDLQNDTGTYREANIWISHDI